MRMEKTKRTKSTILRFTDGLKGGGKDTRVPRGSRIFRKGGGTTSRAQEALSVGHRKRRPRDRRCSIIGDDGHSIKTKDVRRDRDSRVCCIISFQTTRFRYGTCACGMRKRRARSCKTVFARYVL